MDKKDTIIIIMMVIMLVLGGFSLLNTLKFYQENKELSESLKELKASSQGAPKTGAQQQQQPTGPCELAFSVILPSPSPSPSPIPIACNTIQIYRNGAMTPISAGTVVETGDTLEFRVSVIPTGVTGPITLITTIPAGLAVSTVTNPNGGTSSALSTANGSTITSSLTNSSQTVVIKTQVTANSGTLMIEATISPSGGITTTCSTNVILLGSSPLPSPSRSPSPSPSPSRSPSPSPSPSPVVSYSCVSLGPVPSAQLPGQQVIFTCTSTALNTTVNHFNFRVNSGTATRVAPLTANPNKANYTYLVPEISGDFMIQCQVCTSSDDSVCTTWGQAN